MLYMWTAAFMILYTNMQIQSIFRTSFSTIVGKRRSRKISILFQEYSISVSTKTNFREFHVPFSYVRYMKSFLHILELTRNRGFTAITNLSFWLIMEIEQVRLIALMVQRLRSEEIKPNPSGCSFSTSEIELRAHCLSLCLLAEKMPFCLHRFPRNGKKQLLNLRGPWERCVYISRTTVKDGRWDENCWNPTYSKNH